MHGNNSKRGSSNTLTSSIYVVLLEQELKNIVFQQVLIYLTRLYYFGMLILNCAGTGASWFLSPMKFRARKMTRYPLSVHEIQGEKDDKIFADCVDDPEYMHYNDIKELLPHRLVEIRRFKDHILPKISNAVVW